jgi:hypothetical protein
MKKKPDILVVLAAILGLGIAATSVGSTNERQVRVADASPQVVQLNQ